MFQNFANYLLGSVINQDQGATAEGVENSSIRLTSREQDDWVLVDRDSEGNSDASSEEDILEQLEFETNSDSDADLPTILTRTSSTSSLPYTSNMEESWFVTPPPCFTSAGPIHMETSPLENLLIEHPSMSVYHLHPRRHITLSQVNIALPQVSVTVPIRATSPAASCGSHVEEEEVVEENEQAAVEYRPPRLNRLQILQQQEKLTLKSRRAQKVQMQRACQAFKRGCLERNNKAREVNSRNRRQRRAERSQGATRSYANNNRKC